MLLEKDALMLWHPYSPLVTDQAPLEVLEARGAYLHLADGRRLLDGISSWWVNLHGHAHPYLIEALHKQATQLDHTLFAGFTHAPAVRLAERLLSFWNGNMRRVFYSDNGSTSVEAAIKLAMQYFLLSGKKNIQLIAIDGAFHGDTFGAMAVSGKSIFNEAFEGHLLPVKHIPFPIDERCLASLQTILEAHEACIFIYEPLLQGAAGMRAYEASLLNKMLKAVHAYQGICIADEVLTGFGRTGTMFASQQVHEQPDLVCLSKGITGGLMPFAATLVNARMEEPFLSNEFGRIFYHGHSYTANPLACALGIASLELFEKENTLNHIQLLNSCQKKGKEHLKSCNSISRIDVMGTMLSVEFQSEEEKGYLNSIRQRSYAYFLSRGFLLRPLGNVSYVLPPYCVSTEELNRVHEALYEFAHTL
ncbi:MAG: adenosylmethionine--8-amino-7-oxononanoate transaminase [Cytophagaceae bacterium]|jgi:adenosylmethionine-8-amino-7-oxononanoate aminotransferase|nr:adenosylmethionine--8-amino-7-oxononanoate transaminase [Cytophagaceae bacterium]